MRSLSPLVFAAVLLGSCQFNPRIPSGRVICQNNDQCPRDYTCEQVLQAANKAVLTCCRARGCLGELTPDEVNLLSRKADEINARDAGSDAPPKADGGGSRSCGNMSIEPGETCDPGDTCPTTCPAIGCTLQKLEGSSRTCDAKCVEAGKETTCKTGDSCCPMGCTAANDRDCECTCGNNMIETACGERCDPPGSCPASCPQMGCQLRRLVNEGTCQAECVANGMQSECMSGDGCCPSNCNSANDNDCSARCGNDVREGNEKCDGDCPTACPNQSCQRRRLQGSAGECTAECVDEDVIRSCTNSDGCCGNGCTSVNDNDCSAQCGNGAREGNEKCDGADCPTSCPTQGCQRRRLQGSAAQCTAECVNSDRVTMCANGDGCCPSGCNRNTDNDCPAVCGNGVVEMGESCDPMASCQSQSDACVSDQNFVRTRTGMVANCTFRCTQTARACSMTSDGQCPTACMPCGATCAANQDIDCKLQNGAACTHANQCMGGICTTFFRDQDGDTFGGTAVRVCGMTAPVGTVAVGGDCCDTDNRARPNQIMHFPAMNMCGSFDYNCNGQVERHFTWLEECTQDACARGWVGPAIPACGATAPWLFCRRVGGSTGFCDQIQETETQICR